MPSRPVRRPAQNRVIDALADRVDDWAVTTQLLSRVVPAVVTSVTTGGASDGNALVLINWMGTEFAAPYLSTYTPAVGHVVAALKTGPQMVIVGRIIGTP